MNQLLHSVELFGYSSELTGEIPEEIDDLSNLAELALHQNHLADKIQADFW